MWITCFLSVGYIKPHYRRPRTCPWRYLSGFICLPPWTKFLQIPSLNSRVLAHTTPKTTREVYSSWWFETYVLEFSPLILWGRWTHFIPFWLFIYVSNWVGSTTNKLKHFSEFVSRFLKLPVQVDTILKVFGFTGLYEAWGGLDIPNPPNTWWGGVKGTPKSRTSGDV